MKNKKQILEYHLDNKFNILVNKIGYVKLSSGKEIIGYLDRDGYRYITPKINGVKKNIKVHRLVAETFIPNPEKKCCVNHIDGNKQNNKIENLEWCTHSENIKHAVILNFCTNSSKAGENHNTAKHTNIKVEKIRNLYKTKKYTMWNLAKKFNTSCGYISDVVNSKIRKNDSKIDK